MTREQIKKALERLHNIEFGRLHRSHSGNVGIDFAIPFDPSRPTSEIEPQVRARVEELQKLFSGISSVWILWPKAELRSRRVRETRWEFYWLPGESSIIYLRDRRPQHSAEKNTGGGPRRTPPHGGAGMGTTAD